MKIVMILLTVVILSGCYNPSWHRSDTTYEQMRQDSENCKGKLTIGHPTREEKILQYEKCMKERGYVLKGEVKQKGPATPEIEQKSPATISSIYLPEYQISPPPSGAPTEIKTLLGRWQGYWKSGSPAVLVVQKVFLEEKKLECIYAWGPWASKKEGKPGFSRLFAKLIPGPRPKATFSLGKRKYTFTLEGDLLKGTSELEGKINEIVMEKVE